ncbi:hypothetical protein SADUNF_Sadunf18G0056600 [Salix dunnii]|uniref:AN1-type domain-containing protein n=1 Tax=Salix dunnii TaxID=1413687 RepID=A0A835J459_9ROSI|nr:hypothetical protein SADUNF_Sadunf18G0056600 [Salix dunnii]
MMRGYMSILCEPLDQLLAQSSSASVSPSFTPPSVDVIKNQVGPVLMAKGDEKEEVKAEPTVVTPQQKPNRCLTCRRRVGLTGFKCRCGMVFCGTPRYPEQHGCEYDFKSSGKEQIAKANPVVKGEKLQKI